MFVTSVRNWRPLLEATLVHDGLRYVETELKVRKLQLRRNPFE